MPQPDGKSECSGEGGDMGRLSHASLRALGHVLGQGGLNWTLLCPDM